MKEKITMMKKLRLAARVCAGAVLCAALILSCTPLFEAPPEAAGGSEETGRVVLIVSTGGAAPARTVLPTAAPVFSRYELAFSKGAETITVSDTAGIDGAGVDKELAAGIWTAAVTAYRIFSIGGTEREYKAAQGESTITVAAGQTTPVTVTLKPLPVADKTVNGSLRGIFTYKVSFPVGATATLTFGSETPVALASGREVSVEKAPGYYDLFISLKKGGFSAGLSEKVHIYAGLESAAVFAFDDDDFVQSVYLASTLILPTGVTVSSGTINAYSDADYTSRIEIGTPSVPEGGDSRLIAIPAANVGRPIYLKAVITGNDRKTYILTATTVVPKKGVQDIVLADTAPPAPVTGLAGTLLFGNGQIKLTWTDPADEYLDHIEIRWTSGDGMADGTYSVAKGRQTYTAEGLTGRTTYTFTVYAVDTAGNRSAGESTGPWRPDVFSISEVAGYLDNAPGGTEDNPVPLPVYFGMTAADWSNLLSTIQSRGKYVALDLSDCTMTNTEFDPGTNSTGERNIVSLVLPDTATSIKAGSYNNFTFTNSPFKYFTALKSVSGEKVRTVGDYAFYGCTGLTTVNFPAATTIGKGAFYGCFSLTTVNLPAATTIGEGAFYACFSLTRIELPAGLTSIGSLAFQACISLSEFTVDSANPNYKHSSDKKMLLSKGGTTTLIAYPTAKGALTLDATITAIGEGAFSYCEGLTTVNLTAARSIGEGAFSYCTGLTTVDLPAAIDIGADAFYDCTALTTVNLPKARSIGDYAFYDYTRLTTVNLDAAESIGNNAFRRCTGLTTVNLPKVRAIGANAFSGFTGLTTVNLNAAESIGVSAFAYTGLTEVTLPKATAIGSSAFEGCEGLTTVNLPKARSIGDYAFADCTGLTTVNLPAATDIGEGAFWGCRSLTRVDLPKATSIGERAFYGCTGLTTVDLPAATAIGDYAFDGCTGLTRVDLPAATAIGEGAFWDCHSLTRVNLPAVTDIGNGAFAYTGDKAITITLGATAPTLGIVMFYGVGSKTVTVKVPRSGAPNYTDNWINKFKEGGTNITLRIEVYP